MSISARSSLAVGLEALRANPLRTLLSTLGVVMGVAAMVSVLSIGDGVEAFAREQIENTTDLLGISVSSRTTTNIDGQFVRRPDAIQFTRADAESLLAVVKGETKTAMTTMGAALVQLDSGTAPRGFGMVGVLSTHFAGAELPFIAGAPFADTDTAVVVLNARAAGWSPATASRPRKRSAPRWSSMGTPTAWWVWCRGGTIPERSWRRSSRSTTPHGP
jgi:hypothetical protein